MADLRNYPENRLNIRVDQNGNVRYEQNQEFAKYYAPTREELEEELEELQYQLEQMELDEPLDPSSFDHDEWEDTRNDLEDQIRELEEQLEEMNRL